MTYFALLATTSDDVFKSMSDSANSQINPQQVISVVAALIAIVMLISIFGRRATKPKTAKVVNHQGRLTREMAKAMGLRRRELKRLKQLAEQQGVENPLALLLCPSVLKAAIAKADRPAGRDAAGALIDA
ncbi:MAG: hypothetical protein ACTHM6_00135 [Tepidisphaeraceae bacterium]